MKICAILGSFQKTRIIIYLFYNNLFVAFPFILLHAMLLPVTIGLTVCGSKFWYDRISDDPTQSCQYTDSH